MLILQRDGSSFWKATGNLSLSPDWHEQDGFILILSGYLDQRDRLHASLGLSSDAAQTLTDAALVLAAWRRWGESGLARLHGPIALVLADLSDSQRPRIVLYREPLGRRGLYYFSSPQLLLVADEPAALLAHPAVSSQPDEHWLAGHFALARPADNRTALPRHSQAVAGRAPDLHARGHSVAPGTAGLRPADPVLSERPGIRRAFPGAAGPGRGPVPAR